MPLILLHGGGDRSTWPIWRRSSPARIAWSRWICAVSARAPARSPDPRWWADLTLVTAPTLMLAGGPASNVPQHLFTEALSLLESGHLTEIPAGHSLHRAAPDDFLAAVLPFLSR